MPTTFANTINGNPIYAARAESDKDGNRIDTTYAKLSDIPPGVTVDQTYNSSSTNAQSGTAVAEAVQALDAEVTSSDGTNVQVKVTEANGKVTAVNITTDNTESKFNKKQSIDDSSTTDYPSSKAVADFVNSSVATATARFLGSFTLTDLSLTYGATNAQIATALDNHTWPVGTTPTNNDYVYVEIENPQTTGIDDEVRRFKFNGTVWAYEYTLNNSSFTAAEKAAIDSGITSTLVTTYSGHVADSTIHVTSSDKSTWNAKQDAISDLATIRSGASAGATAVQPGDLATVATTGSYGDLLNKPTIPAAQVQSDWEQTNTQAVDYIKNKTNMPIIVPGRLSRLTSSADILSICQYIIQKCNITTPSQASHITLNKVVFVFGTARDSVNEVDVDCIWVLKDIYYNALGDYVFWFKTMIPAGSLHIDLYYSPSGPTGSVSSVGGMPFSEPVQADWDETDSALASYIQNKPAVSRIIPGSITTSSTSAELMEICDLIDQYESSGDDLLVKGEWGSDTHVLWRFLEKEELNQTEYLYKFSMIVEGTVYVFLSIFYNTDPNRTEASIDYTSEYNLSTQTLHNGNCIRINYNQTTQHQEIDFTTTAGITDIQRVASLPANPVSTVLYLIPAT